MYFDVNKPTCTLLWVIIFFIFLFFSSLANPASLAQFEGDIKGQRTNNISRSSKLD